MRDGWIPPFSAVPSPSRTANYGSTRPPHTAAKITDFIAFLVSSGRCIKASSPPLVISPLGAAFRSSDTQQLKPRTVWDGTRSGINTVSLPWPFRFTGLDYALAHLRPGDWMVKVDLAKWYTQLPLHPTVQPYFGFHWAGDDYMYTSIPFGLSSAPAFASLVSAEIAAIARHRGIPVVAAYIDDFFLAAPSAAAARIALTAFTALLSELGVQYGADKVEGPSQKLDFIGVTIDTVQATLSLAPARASALVDALRRASTAPQPPRFYESLCGKLAWFAPVAPNIRPLLRPLYGVPTDRPSRLPSASTAPLIAIIHAATLHPAPIWHWRTPRNTVVLRTDASGTIGYGGHIGPKAFARPWTPSWRSCRSMTARELWPVAEALRLFPHRFRSTTLLATLDNSSSVFALCRASSPCRRSARILRLIFHRAHELDCIILPMHVPRTHLTVADALSRFSVSFTGDLRLEYRDPSSSIRRARTEYQAACTTDRRSIYSPLRCSSPHSLATYHAVHRRVRASPLQLRARLVS